MPSRNYVEIIGHAGQDAEVRYLASGSPVCSFSVATTEHWKDKSSGEKQERTEWHRVQVWGKLAEVCGEYVKKGMLVFVSGSIRTNEWTDKDGVDRRDKEINGKEVLFLTKRDSEKPSADPVRPRPALNDNMADDDIPF